MAAIPASNRWANGPIARTSLRRTCVTSSSSSGPMSGLAREILRLDCFSAAVIGSPDGRASSLTGPSRTAARRASRRPGRPRRPSAGSTLSRRIASGAGMRPWPVRGWTHPIAHAAGLWIRTLRSARAHGPGRSLVALRLAEPRDEDILMVLFAAIDQTLFRPHESTRQEAHRIATHSRGDVYAVIMDSGRLVAYGMMLGWDEGYEVPSLGVAPRADSDGRVLGGRR